MGDLQLPSPEPDSLASQTDPAVVAAAVIRAAGELTNSHPWPWQLRLALRQHLGQFYARMACSRRGTDHVLSAVSGWSRTQVSERCLGVNRLARRRRVHRSGDGLVAAQTGSPGVLLTTSCTHALDMADLLLGVGPGDEVICPSFTFPSAATAIAREVPRLCSWTFALRPLTSTSMLSMPLSRSEPGPSASFIMEALLPTSTHCYRFWNSRHCPHRRQCPRPGRDVAGPTPWHVRGIRNTQLARHKEHHVR